MTWLVLAHRVRIGCVVPSRVVPAGSELLARVRAVLPVRLGAARVLRARVLSLSPRVLLELPVHARVLPLVSELSRMLRMILRRHVALLRRHAVITTVIFLLVLQVPLLVAHLQLVHLALLLQRDVLDFVRAARGRRLLCSLSSSLELLRAHVRGRWVTEHEGGDEGDVITRPRRGRQRHFGVQVLDGVDFGDGQGAWRLLIEPW